MTLLPIPTSVTVTEVISISHARFGRISSARLDHGHRTVGQLLRHFHHNEKQDVPPATRQPSASQYVHLGLYQSPHQSMAVYFQVGKSTSYIQVQIIQDP